jgi:hypothetical protein
LVAFRAFIFQLDLLDADRTPVSIEVGQYLVFRNPATVNLVGEDELSGLIVELQNDVLTEVFQRNLRATPGIKAPDLLAQFTNSGS